MGYRTVVVLYNDQAGQWENDTNLGKLISQASTNVSMGSKINPMSHLGYGEVVECTHADTNTLALIEGYRLHPLGHGFWGRGITYDDLKVDLLRSWADRLGYKVIKKPEENYGI